MSIVWCYSSNAMLLIVKCNVAYCAMQCCLLCNAMLLIDSENDAISVFLTSEINIKSYLNHI